MPQVVAINTKQRKEIDQKLLDSFGTTFNRDFLMYMHVKKKDIYLLTKKAKEIDFEHLHINNLGLYVANLDNHDHIRLSIEGSQLLGPSAKKNIIELNDQQIRAWIRGKDIPYEHEDNYVMIKNKSDYFGCGRIKQNMLLNFVPKGRRIQSSD